MAVSPAYRLICFLGAALVVLPHLNLGMMSDYKICGDSACESMLSRAQALRDYHGKDCRFLSFRKGNTIIVYHKLTGKRDDLWAGSIDRQFGYFPKDAVQEEQVYAAIQKVVETRKSDFFCMDEFGYPTDSSHLDSDDDDESDEENQVQESETTKTSAGNPNSNALTSGDPLTESTVPVQEVEQDEKKNDGDAAEDSNENPAVLNEQGGSPSTAWLSSSMTGWLGLAAEEQADHSVDGKKQDEKKEEIQAENLLASSVTGWFQLGGEGNVDTAEENVISREENAESATSTMSGWLGFGSKKQTDSENEEKEEPVEKFRSRRFSLDLEGSQLHEEEKEDTGTLGWLRNGLSNTLGFNPESGQETSEEKVEKDKEEPAAGSWFEIGGILGFKKDNNEVKTEKAASRSEETENEQERTSSNNADAITLQPALRADEKIESTSASQREEPPMGQTGYLPIKIGEKEYKDEEDEDHLKPKLITDDRKDFVESNQDEIQIPTGTDYDISGQSDIDNSSEEVNSNVTGAYLAKAQEEDEKDSLSVETEADVEYHEDLRSHEDSGLLGRENVSTQGEKSEVESQLISASDSYEKNEPIQDENATFTSQDTETVLVIDDKAEKERSHSEFVQEQETSVGGSLEEFKLAQFTGGGTESLHENALREDEAGASSGGSVQNTKSVVDSEAGSEGGVERNDGGKEELFGVEENKLEDSKQVKEGQEEGEQEEVGQLVDEEEDKNLKDFKEEERYKEVDELEDREKQDDLNEVKEEGVLVEIKPEEKQEDDQKVKEEEEKIVKESEDQNKEGQVDKPNGEKKNEDMVEQKEGVTGETMEEVKEKKQKEEEELEGPNEPMQEEGNGGLHFSHLDDQINKIGEDSSRTESEINKENMQENSLSFVEPSTETGNSLLEEEKWNEKKEKQEVLAELYGTMVQTEERQGEDENLECSNGLCTEGCGKALVVAGDKGSTEVGESLASEGMKGEQNNHTNGAQERKPIQYDDTVEREKELEIVDFDNTEGNDLWRKEGQELSASASDPEENVSHGSVASPDDQSKETAESESTGTFGGFKHVFGFGFFSQPSTSDTQKSTQPAQISDLSLDNSEEQDYSAPGVDSYTDSSKNQDEPPESPTEETQSYSPPADTSVNTPSPNLEAPLQTKDLSKHYKILLSYLNAEEITILLDLFGQHKLQFLDYVLSSSEAEDPTGHQSIVSDIERLLQHHTEKLVAPSIRLNGAPQEDKYKTRTLIVLQKLEMLLETVKKSFNAGQSDVSIHPAETSCLGLYCSTSIKDQEMYTEEQATKKEDPSGAVENNMNKEELIVIESDTAGINRQILDFVHQMTKEFITTSKESRNLIVWLTNQVVSALPDDIRPGPDLYGMPWEPIIITGVVGLVTILLFMCRCYSSVKSRMYRSKERGMAEQVTQLLDEKCKVLETLSQCQQEYDELEDSLKDSGVLAQHQKTEELEGKAKHLAHAKRELERDLENLKDHLNQQREQRTEQERRISVLEVSLKTCEEEITDLQSQDEQAQTTVKVYNMNSDRLERNLETAKEENTVLQESNAQLKQQVEGWAERVSELEGEMRRCEVAHSGMLQDVTNKDERIMSLTDRLLRMKGWDSDLEEEDGEKEATNGTAGNGKANESVKVTDPQVHLQKVQKLINAAKLNADLKSVDEDKDRVFARLSDEVKAKEDLQAAMKELESEKSSLQSDAEHYSDQVQRLQQKLHIMTEMYQENELKLHRLLTVEEKERSQKEQKLNKADKNIAMAMEELNNYRQRAGEMEDELEKTKQSYQTQISAHEKKAHNNWLAARAADRELADIRRENGLLRQKLTDTQFKLDALDKDPYALDSLARPLPFRGERSPYGPSPLGRPGSETRAFLSPPTLMEGPPARLSPRVPRGPGEPPSGQGEMERSGGPHSDSGSISPTWDRDRRGPPPGHPGPLGPPGYMFPEPGGPMYRRAPPHPGAMGHMPPPGPLPPGGFPIRGFPPGPPHPLDMADGPYRENSLGATEQEHRESGLGERKTPPESEQRMGGPPLPSGPPIGPMDGPFPRRPPYGPPPPDFYPPRGPGAPPMMPMWAPRALPPPGMMLPPRFPPHPHVPPYGAPMRPPHPSDGLPPPSMGPPLHQQSLPPQQDNTPSPEDAI